MYIAIGFFECMHVAIKAIHTYMSDLALLFGNCSMYVEDDHWKAHLFLGMNWMKWMCITSCVAI